MLCLISLVLALRLLRDNSLTSMIYVIKILQMTGISTFPANILDKAESLRYLQRARQLIPDHASTHYYLGRNYEAMGQVSKALEHYRTALELSQGKAEWASDAKERLRRLGGM